MRRLPRVRRRGAWLGALARVARRACRPPAPSRYSMTCARIALEARVVVERLAVARPRDVDGRRPGRAWRPGPAVSGMMRSASRMPSSTSLVIRTTVLLVLLPDALDLVLQRGARQRVERAERLVQQQDLRVHRQRAGHGHALPHAAGQLARAACPARGVRLTMRDVASRRAPASAPRGQSGKTWSTARQTFS